MHDDHKDAVIYSLTRTQIYPDKKSFIEEVRYWATYGHQEAMDMINHFSDNEKISICDTAILLRNVWKMRQVEHGEIIFEPDELRTWIEDQIMQDSKPLGRTIAALTTAEIAREILAAWK